MWKSRSIADVNVVKMVDIDLKITASFALIDWMTIGTDKSLPLFLPVLPHHLRSAAARLR
jgi:hypothetical protein